MSANAISCSGVPHPVRAEKLRDDNSHNYGLTLK